jgi:hypothetical protein
MAHVQEYSIGMDEKLVTIDIEPEDEFQAMVMNIFINEGRRREREDIIEALHTLGDASCCCDSATFGDHYLSERQPDNLIKLINMRKIG